VSVDTKEHVVEWTFAGGWLLLLLIGVAVSWRMSVRDNRGYRAFVPFIGVLTAFLLVGTIVLGSHYFPE
jgi:uncharacterized membrane protein